MYLLLGLPIGLLLTFLARFGSWAEDIYAKGVHAFFENTVGRLVSLLPFSVTEWLIVAAVLGAVTYLVFVIIWLCRNKSAWKHILYRTFINVLCAVSLSYFLFVITMGLAYYRKPATEYMDLSVRQYSVEELKEVTLWLAKSANTEREKLSEDENGVSVLSSDFWETSAEAQRSFNKISEKYPKIGQVSARNKPMVFSKVMSSTMTLGVYFPYTFESNINIDATPYTIPATMCHELSHVKGFMREDEANFIGFLACMLSERADFRYSGYMSAFVYALNRLANEDYAAATEVAKTVSAAVIRDDNAENKYWDQYEDTVISETTGQIYNEYLQSNNQSDGLKSYGKMLDLIIAWYQTEVKAK